MSESGLSVLSTGAAAAARTGEGEKPDFSDSIGRADADPLGSVGFGTKPKATVDPAAFLHAHPGVDLGERSPISRSRLSSGTSVHHAPVLRRHGGE